ncbi:hypothetical protein JOB18_027921 [Solea senegalensis]|uniref:Uncharacterized protein n=1 Tax=Solea senegalensis TaxID=28829 RepID=A0AAV6RDW3_SOLSE|nr:hypothetical protein JOB18_027921 [Solea senegalensis]
MWSTLHRLESCFSKQKIQLPLNHENTEVQSVGGFVCTARHYFHLVPEFVIYPPDQA